MAATVNITWDDSKLQNFLAFAKERPKRLDSAVRRTAQKAWKWITRDTPHRTGTAQLSWEVKPISPMQYTVISDIGAGKRYTPFLEDGTGIYGPEGKRIFKKRYKTAFGASKAIGNPGFPGFHMIGKNEPAIQDQLNYEIQKEIDKANQK